MINKNSLPGLIFPGRDLMGYRTGNHGKTLVEPERDLMGNPVTGNPDRLTRDPVLRNLKFPVNKYFKWRS